MRALVKLGPDSNEFKLMDVPIPTINEDELLVSVKAIGVGIHDGYFFPENIQFPYPIGIEGSGIIEKAGKNFPGFMPGDRIAFVSMQQPKGGTYAEYAALGKKSLVVHIPPEMSFAQAAAIPVAGNTILKVYQALELKTGQSIFIAGASGAIGMFAIPLAVAKGCSVAASASKKNHDFLKSLGAEKAVDYHDTDWVEQVRQWRPDGVDAGIAIQPNTSSQSMDTVKDGGKIISVSGDRIEAHRNIRVVQLPYHIDVKDDLLGMFNKIAQKEMPLFIEHIFQFDDALKALTLKGSRHARGKSVIVLP